MKSLYLRIWLTVVAALALFALVSGWMWQRHMDQERQRFELQAGERQRERLQAWAELVQHALPEPDAPAPQQAQALADWSARLRVPMALDNATGERIATSEAYRRREAEVGANVAAGIAVLLDDGRTLWLARRGPRRGPPPAADAAAPDGGPAPGRGGAPPRHSDQPFDNWPLLAGLPGRLGAVGPLALVGLLFAAVAAGAYPVVRRLTRRLEALQRGVEAFGAGNLKQRVDASGSDEVAAVAATFNRSAERIESLVRAHQSLLANASHELRSPLARLKMAVDLYADASQTRRADLRREIDTDVAELDSLVEEVLLASRLDAAASGGARVERNDSVDLVALAAEQAARVGADVDVVGAADSLVIRGSERLLRRALRNLLENARRYGGDEVQLRLSAERAALRIEVLDRGPGVPAELRERIFEPFYRLPGHAEREGGVGLGLSLVRQIARAHGGSVHCEAREGGGSRFVLALPDAALPD